MKTKLNNNTIGWVLMVDRGVVILVILCQKPCMGQILNEVVGEYVLFSSMTQAFVQLVGYASVYGRNLTSGHSKIRQPLI